MEEPTQLRAPRRTAGGTKRERAVKIYLSEEEIKDLETFAADHGVAKSVAIRALIRSAIKNGSVNFPRQSQMFYTA